jgi:hypothetical protein
MNNIWNRLRLIKCDKCIKIDLINKFCGQDDKCYSIDPKKIVLFHRQTSAKFRWNNAYWQLGF